MDSIDAACSDGNAGCHYHYSSNLLTLPASSSKRLCNGTVSVCLSICVSVPSIDSSSDAQLV